MQNIRVKTRKDTTFKASCINTKWHQIMHSVKHTFTDRYVEHKAEGEVLKKNSSAEGSLRLSKFDKLLGQT